MMSSYLIVDPNLEVASSDDVALVEVLDPFGRGLDVQFPFSYVARRRLHKACLLYTSDAADE